MRYVSQLSAVCAIWSAGALAADGSIYDYLDTHYPSAYQRAEQESVTAKELPVENAIEKIPEKPGGVPNPTPSPAAAPTPKIITVDPVAKPQQPEIAKPVPPAAPVSATATTQPADKPKKPWHILEPDQKEASPVPTASAPKPIPAIIPEAASAPAQKNALPVEMEAQAPLPRGGHILRSQFTTMVTKLEPADHVSQISVSQGNIRYFSEVKDLEGEVLTHRWLKGGKTLLEKRMNIGSDQWRVWSSMRLKPEYEGLVSVLTLDKAGNVLHEERLTVTR